MNLKTTHLRSFAFLLFAACASTGGAGARPERAPREDALANDVVSKDDGVRQCVLMERVRDPGFRVAHARVHVAAGGAVDSVAVLDGRPELGDCIARALRLRSLAVEPNGPSDDYDIRISL